MCAAANFMLGLLYLLLCFKDWRAPDYAFPALMALKSSSSALIELARPQFCLAANNGDHILQACTA